MAGADVLLQNIRAGHVCGHEIRRELDPFEGQAQRLGQGAHQQRLGGTRHAGDQAMAAHQQGDQQALDHLVLTDDDLAHLAADARHGGLERLHQRPDCVGGQIRELGGCIRHTFS